MGDKTGVGSPKTIHEWKRQKSVPKKVDRPFILSIVAISFAIFFTFNVVTWIMIDTYHRGTLKRVIRIEKKLNAANKQIKWLRQALGVTVKGRVKKDSRLDKLEKFIDKQEK